MRLVSTSEWITRALGLPAIWTARLHLLDQDVQSVQVSFAAYSASILRGDLYPGPGVNALSHAETFHHAKAYVCAMRRVARIARSCVAARSELPQAQADAVQLAWKKKSAFFDTYTEPRNAIEHIDENIPHSDRIVMMTLTGTSLAITEDPRQTAVIGPEAVEKAVALRNDLIAAICGVRPIGR